MGLRVKICSDLIGKYMINVLIDNWNFFKIFYVCIIEIWCFVVILGPTFIINVSDFNFIISLHLYIFTKNIRNTLLLMFLEYHFGLTINLIASKTICIINWFIWDTSISVRMWSLKRHNWLIYCIIWVGFLRAIFKCALIVVFNYIANVARLTGIKQIFWAYNILFMFIHIVTLR